MTIPSKHKHKTAKLIDIRRVTGVEVHTHTHSESRYKDDSKFEKLGVRETSAL